MNILVTGANGQLGRELARVAKYSKHRFVFTDIAELDISDCRSVMETVAAGHFEVIVNCAAYTNVDKAEDDRMAAETVNCKAVVNLAAAARGNGALLIHVSTDYVFDGKSCVPYKEDDEPHPTGVYGETKYAGEKAVIDSDCRYIILRTAWLYSQWGKNFVKTMRKLTAEKDSLSVVFDQVGSPTYAGDLADFIGRIIEKGQLSHQGIYHFSDEGVCSWYDFAKEICELSGNVCDINPCHSEEFPSKVNRPHYSVLDKTKLKTTFGVKIPYWRDSLIKCIEALNRTESQD